MSYQPEKCRHLCPCLSPQARVCVFLAVMSAWAAKADFVVVVVVVLCFPASVAAARGRDEHVQGRRQELAWKNKPRVGITCLPGLCAANSEK